MTVMEEYQPVFVGKVMGELQEVLQRYPAKQAALLPALWIAQRERGWISDRTMAEVGEVLGLTPAYVKGVVTFYTMYHQHPVGSNFVQVCTTSPCNICGAEDVVKALLAHTGAKELGATSPDGKWTVIEVECLGAGGDHGGGEGIGAAGARRGGVPDGAQVVVHAEREEETPLPVRERGRVRARDLQGPGDHALDAARAARGHADRDAGDPGRGGLHLHPRRVHRALRHRGASARRGREGRRARRPQDPPAPRRRGVHLR